MNVKDSDVVIDFMLKNKIGYDDPKVYNSLAYFYEKYQRNFKKTEETFISALSLSINEKFNQSVRQKYKEFSERMQKRTERDVIYKIGEL